MISVACSKAQMLRNQCICFIVTWFQQYSLNELFIIISGLFGSKLSLHNFSINIQLESQVLMASLNSSLDGVLQAVWW
jgi:hypothetical protein